MIVSSPDILSPEWMRIVSSSAEAFGEVGLFGNQNKVCLPTTPKWRHTVDRLKVHFRNWNSHATA